MGGGGRLSLSKNGKKKMRIAIIGTGNMGGAIVHGLIQSAACRPEDIICTAKSESTLQRIRLRYPSSQVTKDNVIAASEADIIILAVKPWLIQEVINEIRPVLDYNRQVIASVAAGVSLDCLMHYLIPDYEEKKTANVIAETMGMELSDENKYVEPALFRVVPNTAVEVMEGVTFIASRGASDSQCRDMHALFSSLGYVLDVGEHLIPAGTALASCGIAFAMRYIRAAMEGGVELGFRPSEAARIVEYTVRGAATLLLDRDAHPEGEIDKVTTAGGITIKGLNAMEKAGFTNAVIEGLKASR